MAKQDQYNAVSDRRQPCVGTQDSIAKGDRVWVDKATGAVFVDHAAARRAGCP